MKELSDIEIQQAFELSKQYPPERIEQERAIVKAQTEFEALSKKVIGESTADSLEATRAMLEANREPLKIMQGIENAVYQHKESTDKAIGIHEEQLDQLKTANQSLNAQVSKLSDTVKVLEKQLQESEKQTFELIDANELLKKQINDAEVEIEKQKETNRILKRNQKILFYIAIVSFGINIITTISNPNIHDFFRKFFE
ncbi:hypothetical protein [Sebaldella sp. S0638]|uniref:hypothetical protein n=1 Tax=Sebaldella sp. S0638 TaxID=2957809 RepID=UPI0020A1CA0A|nr:hypothetical protein [Sebaldella sp. S0638]MCP1226649.1 hypothetical protein [Sebaldella sp. S0638]